MPARGLLPGPRPGGHIRSDQPAHGVSKVSTDRSPQWAKPGTAPGCARGPVPFPIESGPRPDKIQPVEAARWRAISPSMMRPGPRPLPLGSISPARSEKKASLTSAVLSRDRLYIREKGSQSGGGRRDWEGNFYSSLTSKRHSAAPPRMEDFNSTCTVRPRAASRFC